MKVHSGDVTVEVKFSRDSSANWHFEYDIPNFRGTGQAMRISSDMEFESEEAAKEHAQLAVIADLEKNQSQIDAS